MKKIIILLIFMLCLTGCSIVKVNNESIDSIINTTLLRENNLSNVSFEGYKYYVPDGVKLLEKNATNAKLVHKNVSYYLYVDVISYYHKAKLDYVSTTDNYYSKAIGNNGYIEITKVKDKYFIELMYNYAKIEAYVDSNNLEDSLIYMCNILSSVKFNDDILATFIGENILNYQEENFNLFKPKRETGNFKDYLELYDKYNDVNNELPADEDKIETDDDTF